MIQIGLISHSPHLTGAEKMLLNLAVLLKKSNTGINPVLIVPGYEGGLYLAALDCKIDVRVVKLPKWYVFANPNDVQYWNELADSHLGLRNILKESGCNCVLVNTLTNIGGAMAAIDLKLPLITWVHGVIDSFLLPNRTAADWAYLHDRFLLDSSFKIIAVSKWVKVFLDEISSGYSGKTVQIYNWTAVNHSTSFKLQSSSPRRFVCLNTFDKFKGHDTLIDAFDTLIRDGYDISLYLYGTGGNIESIRDKCKKLGMQNKVFFMPRTVDTESVYKDSFCLINPSFVESFGMTIIEAMSCMVPIISAQSGGPEEFIEHGKNGLLFPAGDVQALAACMRVLLDNPELASNLGHAGYETVRLNFNGDVALGKFIEAIHQTINEFNGYNSAVQTLKDLFQIFYNNVPDISPDKPSQQLIDLHTHTTSFHPVEDSKKLLGVEFYGKFILPKRRLEYSIYIPANGLSGLIFGQCPPIFPETCNVDIKIKTLAGKTIRNNNLILHNNVASSYLPLTQLSNSKGQIMTLEVEIFQPNIKMLKLLAILLASRLLNHPLGRTLWNIRLVLG